jgi:DNA polymerase III subunit delta'
MNWNMLGHEWAVNLLKEQVTHGKVRHAYLFTGPHQVGRRTLALRLAQALNCLQPPAPGEPCGVCRACMQIERMQHPDLSVIQAEQRGGTLKVEQVREVQRSLSLAPYEAKYRVALLLHFEEANLSSANALLKTLEEPASKVILILTAESAEILLPTIVSRCELLRLRPLPVEQVNQGLQKRWGIPAEQSSLLAAIADGRPGYAVHLYQHPEILEQRRLWLDEHARLLSANRVERFRFAEAGAKDKEMCRAMLFVWLSFWRDVMILATGAAAPPANLDRSDQVVALARQVGYEGALKVTTALENTIQRLDQNVNIRLALEVLLLDLPEARILFKTE